MEAPNLADPDFEPSDEQFAELMRRAFAGVTEAHLETLRKLHAEIAVQSAEALRLWFLRESCNPS